MEQLKNIGVIPVNSDILYSLYGDLVYPVKKIIDLERKGFIIKVKRNLYVVSPKVHNLEISRELVANHLYRPSYISLETALSYYGFIPERVYSVRSVCMKHYKQYDTPLGHFEYIKVSENYFQIGINQEIINNSYAFLIATPTKAICDMIVATPNLRLQSVKAMQNYLTEDLRIDVDVLKTLDKDIVRECVEVGRKKRELRLLMRFLEND
jgi:predicted transcriptional regulator of viral defense system